MQVHSEKSVKKQDSRIDFQKLDNICQTTIFQMFAYLYHRDPEYKKLKTPKDVGKKVAEDLEKYFCEDVSHRLCIYISCFVSDICALNDIKGVVIINGSFLNTSGVQWPHNWNYSNETSSYVDAMSYGGQLNINEKYLRLLGYRPRKNAVFSNSAEFLNSQFPNANFSPKESMLTCGKHILDFCPEFTAEINKLPILEALKRFLVTN